jgi:hypothetical protein
MAISETAGACSDPSTGISGAVLSQAQTSGRLRIGSVDGSRSRLSFSVPAGVVGQSFTTVTDSVGASFEEFTLAQVERYSGLVNANTIGACTVYQFRESDGTELADPISGRALNAGTLSLSGPEGTHAITRDTDGFYYELLNPGLSFLRALVSSKKPPTKDQFGSTPYYQTGVHTVTGSGGADVGAFTTTFEVGPPLTWTNPTTSISRASPFTVQWQGGTGDRVVIFGFSAYDFEDDSGSGAAFWCAANRAAGSFTIPQAILASLPPSATVEGLPSGAFAVGSQSLQQTTFPTMDVGLASFIDLSFNFGVGYP